jgi:spermidine synthase
MNQLSVSLTANLNIDPWDQARAWCNQLLIKDKQCVVVGLGSGLHIVELIRQKNLQKVYVIDCKDGFTNMFRKLYPEYNDIVEIIIIADASEILKHEIMAEVIAKGLSSFAYSAAWTNRDDFYNLVHRHLTGRSFESLQLFFARQGIQQEIQIKDDKGAKYLSIKDLDLMIQEDVSPYLRLNCFRILKELII